MHHVLIKYCTLKSIYFAGIAFVCDACAIKLSDIFSVSNGQIPTTISILLGCHGEFEIRIEKGWLTEPVIFFIGHYIYYETMFFLFIQGRKRGIISIVI